MTATEWLEEHEGYLVDVVNQHLQGADEGTRANNFEDLLQAARLGVVQAFERRDYDPSLGSPLTFVRDDVRSAVQQTEKDTWPTVSVSWDVVRGVEPPPYVTTVSLDGFDDVDEAEAVLGEAVSSWDGGYETADNKMAFKSAYKAVLAAVAPQEREALIAVLSTGGDDIGAAARKLGVSKSTLRRRLATVRENPLVQSIYSVHKEIF